MFRIPIDEVRAVIKYAVGEIRHHASSMRARPDCHGEHSQDRRGVHTNNVNNVMPARRHWLGSSPVESACAQKRRAVEAPRIERSAALSLRVPTGTSLAPLALPHDLVAFARRTFGPAKIRRETEMEAENETLR
jgi:hypothetical protein